MLLEPIETIGSWTSRGRTITTMVAKKMTLSHFKTQRTLTRYNILHRVYGAFLGLDALEAEEAAEKAEEEASKRRLFAEVALVPKAKVLV